MMVMSLWSHFFGPHCIAGPQEEGPRLAPNISTRPTKADVGKAKYLDTGRHCPAILNVKSAIHHCLFNIQIWALRRYLVGKMNTGIRLARHRRNR